MQRTSEFAQVTRPAGASAIVGAAQELSAAADGRFTGEANAQAIFLGDLSALAAAELAGRRR